eukprot:CAMPEP_0184986028 /NCGR_PEP_ID=MMETSP1098-20130426/15314_1 /TAXON_ID=89044 /ORGANISM="Spumella elongata, Strain CCAP 955/1" /LENGTH=182 /DNA_ID=CAMNT_0027510181 /DNA_START=52 /DNA_END=597 /DNA_ORIENTATION=+
MSFAKRIVSTGRLAAEKAFVQSRGFKSTTHLQTRVTLNSWSADRLKELGEKIEEGEVLPHTHLTKELLYNPSPKVLRIGNELLACNMIESVQFMSVIQNRFKEPLDDLFGGVALGGMGGGGGGGGAAVAAPEPVKEKEAFDIKLTEVDAKSKIKIIKEVRAITGLGLKEAKDMVEGAPIVVK